MAETTMEPWSFTIVFDEDKAKKNGYEVDTLYDYVGKNVEGLGNERIARGTWRAAKGYDEVDAQTLAIRLKNSDNSKSATSVRSHSPDLRSTDTFHFMASPSKPS